MTNKYAFKRRQSQTITRVVRIEITLHRERNEQDSNRNCICPYSRMLTHERPTLSRLCFVLPIQSMLGLLVLPLSFSLTSLKLPRLANPLTFLAQRLLRFDYSSCCRAHPIYIYLYISWSTLPLPRAYYCLCPLTLFVTWDRTWHRERERFLGAPGVKF